ncbi:transposase family protein [Plantactinospora sp. ZYX-F-223]|uniref:transposase family protein n=1 Tax=Plantactinospora sp. ZYX-F-223 TaxID=3144103 RepID=UPI0031FBE471
MRVRRPRVGRSGRKAFVSGKARQNTIKATVVSDEYGVTLWCGGHRPGRMHDSTAARIEGIDALLDAYPRVRVLGDSGYQGLARTHAGQGTAPPLKLRPPVRHRLGRFSGKPSASSGRHNSHNPDPPPGSLKQSRHDPLT